MIGPAPETVPAITTETGAPVEADTDGDAVADDGEVNSYGTDPWSWDTDGDGLSDGEEIAAGTDPLDPASFPMDAKDPAASASSVDSDNDRLADEAAFGTDPNNPDSGGDGYYDGDEVNPGTHPLDPTIFPAQ